MNRIRTYGVLLLTLIPSLLLLPTARGHIVPEQPWDPVAAAYLRSLFYTRLKPVPWDSIAAEYEAEVAAFAADPGDAARVSVLDVLADADEAVARGIRQAIDDESAVELYLHSTRAGPQGDGAGLGRIKRLIQSLCGRGRR